MTSPFMKDLLRERVEEAVRPVLEEYLRRREYRELLDDLIWSVCATIENNFVVSHGEDDYVDS